MKLKSLIRALCPPLIWNWLARVYFPSIIYRGDFDSWIAAQAASTGYDNSDILNHVIEATDRVLQGKAAFERDGVTFQRPEYPYYLVAPMLSAAMESGGRLSVLDVGGALGSIYRQCRPLLDGVAELRWSVIEQANFVAAGRARYETEELAFFTRLEDVDQLRTPNVLLFSSVLQYLPLPADMLATVRAHCSKASYLLIDRTPFWRGKGDLILVQEVPASIYPSSYPVWIFSYSDFLSVLDAEWHLLDDRLSPEGYARANTGLDFEFRFLLFKRRVC